MSPYGLFYALATFIGLSWYYLRFHRFGFSFSESMQAIAVMSWSGIAGAYLFHSFLSFFPGLFPSGLITRHLGPSTIFGLVGGGALGSLIYGLKKGMPLGKVYDIGVLPLPLAQAIGRIGCFYAGCCFGKPASCILAMPLPGLHHEIAMRYPTQLMSAAANVGILGILLFIEHLRRKRRDTWWPFPGFIFLSWVCLYSGKRFLIEFYRATALPVVGGLTWAQIASLAAFVAAFTAIVIRMKKIRRHALS